MGKVILLYYLRLLCCGLGSNFRTSTIHLNVSSYEDRPDLFKVRKSLDMALFLIGRNAGLQEHATYSPPGPSKPGYFHKVS